MFIEGATCFTCSREFSVDDKTSVFMFFCGHMYHQNCVSHRNEVRIIIIVLVLEVLVLISCVFACQILSLKALIL